MMAGGSVSVLATQPPSQLLRSSKQPPLLLLHPNNRRRWLTNTTHSARVLKAVNISGEGAATTMTDVGRKEAPHKSSSPLQLTYLEGNSWLWEVKGLQILVDPVLVGNLDFGIPWLYDAGKKALREFQLEDLPALDLLLICQSLDDHCHKRTLEPLSKIFPDLQVIATPNAEPILSRFFHKVIYLEPGHSTKYTGKNSSELTIRASAGPVLGPPWQRPENGYFIEANDPRFSMYYEPHCVFKRSSLERERAQVVITPVVKQVLPLYTLVSGQKDAVDLARILQAEIVVPLQNAELESKGLLSKIVSSVGTVEEFRDLMRKELPSVQVMKAEPGIPLHIPLNP